MLRHYFPMSNHPAANRHHLAAPFFPGSQPWEAPDPLPVMRRELKLLLIEMNVLRIEVEQLRESRDHWRREAERLRALITQVPPWSLFWRRCVDAVKAWRNPTDRSLHWA
jgi:hypothetical protein